MSQSTEPERITLREGLEQLDKLFASNPAAAPEQSKPAKTYASHKGQKPATNREDQPPQRTSYEQRGAPAERNKRTARPAPEEQQDEVPEWKKRRSVPTRFQRQEELAEEARRRRANTRQQSRPMPGPVASHASETSDDGTGASSGRPSPLPDRQFPQDDRVEDGFIKTLLAWYLQLALGVLNVCWWGLKKICTLRVILGLIVLLPFLLVILFLMVSFVKARDLICSFGPPDGFEWACGNLDNAKTNGRQEEALWEEEGSLYRWERIYAPPLAEDYVDNLHTGVDKSLDDINEMMHWLHNLDDNDPLASALDASRNMVQQAKEIRGFLSRKEWTKLIDVDLRNIAREASEFGTAMETTHSQIREIYRSSGHIVADDQEWSSRARAVLRFIMTPTPQFQPYATNGHDIFAEKIEQYQQVLQVAKGVVTWQFKLYNGSTQAKTEIWAGHEILDKTCTSPIMNETIARLEAQTGRSGSDEREQRMKKGQSAMGTICVLAHSLHWAHKRYVNMLERLEDSQKALEHQQADAVKIIRKLAEPTLSERKKELETSVRETSDTLLALSIQGKRVN